MNNHTDLTNDEIKELRDLIAKPTPKKTTSIADREPNNAWLRLAGVLVATIVFWVVIIGIQALDSHLGKTRTTSTLSSAEVIDLYDKNQRIDTSRLTKFMEEQQKKIGDENQKTIENQNQRIGDTWSAVQGIGLISAIIGVLITVLVLYFSFQNSEAINSAKADFEKKLEEAAKSFVEKHARDGGFTTVVNENASNFLADYVNQEGFIKIVNTAAEKKADAFLSGPNFDDKVMNAIKTHLGKRMKAGDNSEDTKQFMNMFSNIEDRNAKNTDENEK